jgi:hypothetical protein
VCKGSRQVDDDGGEGGNVPGGANEVPARYSNWDIYCKHVAKYGLIQLPIFSRANRKLAGMKAARGRGNGTGTNNVTALGSRHAFGSASGRAWNGHPACVVVCDNV